MLYTFENGRVCDTCRAFAESWGEDRDDGWGTCRLRAPTGGDWTKVHGSAWCLEWLDAKDPY